MPDRVLHRKRPNKKRRNRRPPINRGGEVGKFASDAWSLARRTAVGLNEIRKLINVENKFFDLNANLTATQAGAVQYLSGIVQGVDLSQRIGDSIRIQRIIVRGTSYVGVTSPTSLRFIIFRDMENGGAAPAGSDIMANAGGAGAAVSEFNYINSQKRFVIVYDELSTLDALSNLTSIESYEHSGLGHVNYRDTTAAVTGAAEGSLWAIALTDAGANQPTIRFSCRIIYTDD